MSLCTCICIYVHIYISYSSRPLFQDGRTETENAFSSTCQYTPPAGLKLFTSLFSDVTHHLTALQKVIFSASKQYLIDLFSRAAVRLCTPGFRVLMQLTQYHLLTTQGSVEPSLRGHSGTREESVTGEYANHLVCDS